MTLRLDHLAIPCFDARATYRFYTEVLGLPLFDAMSGDDWGGKPWLMMIFGLGDARQIAMVAFRGQKRPKEALPADARHYAFLGDLASWKKRLSGAGVKWSEEDHGSQRSIYFQDPNRVTLEITQPGSDVAAHPDPTAAKVVQAWLRRGRR